MRHSNRVGVIGGGTHLSFSVNTVDGAYGYRGHAGIVEGVYTHATAEDIAPFTGPPDESGHSISGTITVDATGEWWVAVAAVDSNGYEGFYSDPVQLTAS